MDEASGRFRTPEKSRGPGPAFLREHLVYSRCGVGAGKVGCFFKCSSGDLRRDSHRRAGGQGSQSPEALSLSALGLFHRKEPEALGLPGHRIGARSCVRLSRCLWDLLPLWLYLRSPEGGLWGPPVTSWVVRRGASLSLCGTRRRTCLPGSCER